MSINHLLNEVVTVQHFKSSISGSQGGRTSVVDGSTFPLKCRVRPVNGTEIFHRGGERNQEVSHVGYTTPAVKVREGDTWTRGGGDVLQVMLVREPSKAHHLEIDLREFKETDLQ